MRYISGYFRIEQNETATNRAYKKHNLRTASFIYYII